MKSSTAPKDKVFVELNHPLCYDETEVNTMSTEQEHNEVTEESKQAQKVSQAEAAKRLLAMKKQANQPGKGSNNGFDGGGKKMKSQMTKKVNNQRKKMGT